MNVRLQFLACRFSVELFCIIPKKENSGGVIDTKIAWGIKNTK